MADRLRQRSWWSTFSIALIGVLMLSLVAACGSDDGDDEDANTDAGADVTMTTITEPEEDETEVPGGAVDEATEATGDAEDESTEPAGGMDDVMAIGACFEENTTSDVVTDLREGNTESAEGVYRECLESELPESLVNQLDPIIEQAATCGEQAANELSEDEVAAIEEGDQATIEQVTNDTLDCLSAELGIDLQ